VLSYAVLGRHADALAAWQAAVRADPDHRDANYNAGQALYNLGDFGKALAHWRRGLELGPEDFFVLKKIVQAENALGLDAAATKARLLEVWRASADPDVRRQQSFVFDQFDAGGWRVMSVELLGDPLPIDADVMRFVVEDRPGHVAFTIRIETSAYARSRGTPFVVSVSDATEYKVVDSYKELPPYHDLRGRVRRLLESIRPGTAYLGEGPGLGSQRPGATVRQRLDRGGQRTEEARVSLDALGDGALQPRHVVVA